MANFYPFDFFDIREPLEKLTHTDNLDIEILARVSLARLEELTFKLEQNLERENKVRVWGRGFQWISQEEAFKRREVNKTVVIMMEGLKPVIRVKVHYDGFFWKVQKVGIGKKRVGDILIYLPQKPGGVWITAVVEMERTKPFYKVGEVAKLLGVHRSTVWLWIKEGKVRAWRFPKGHWRIPREEVLRLLLEREDLDPRDLLTLEEAAKILKVSKPTVWRWVKKGKIPAMEIGEGKGKMYMIKVNDLLWALEQGVIRKLATKPRRQWVG